MVTPFGSPGRSQVNEVRYWVRLFALPVLCLAVAGFALVRAGRISETVEVRPRVETVQAATPVLSVRRLPNVLALPAQAVSLQGPMGAAIDGIPPSSCVSVTNARGVPVFQLNATTPLSPASNQKVLLAHGVLAQFEATRTFGTFVATDAPIVAGTVQGNVWLIGTGDPVLATEEYVNSFEEPEGRVFTPFEALADQIKAAGVTRINGKVVADAGRFDDVLYHPDWPSRFASTGTVGPIAALEIDNGFADFARGGQQLIGSGAASSNPPRSAASTLITLLRDRGVTVDGTADVGTAPPSPTFLAEVQSPPLIDIVGQMLRNSDNTVAEMLFKELGAARLGKGTFEGGAAALTALLTEQGLFGPGTVIADGSGLGGGNKVTCATLNAVLDAAGRQSPLVKALAVSGRSGTMKSRVTAAPTVGRVHAKTGTLLQVTSLSGFVDSARGEAVSFAVIVNAAGADAYKDTEDLVVTALVDYPGGPDVAALGPLG
jgi:D-alanyl-D-alanine carboxypeptidase/D-alanyl-D-alanine-endopeptidase (penicillin-binding protein 4)